MAPDNIALHPFYLQQLRIMVPHNVNTVYKFSPPGTVFTYMYNENVARSCLLQHRVAQQMLNLMTQCR